MKCNDTQHRHTCNSLSNCYWSANVGSFASGVIPDDWDNDNPVQVSSTSDGGLSFTDIDVPEPLVDVATNLPIPWKAGDIFSVEVPSETPDIIPSCNACSQISTINECNSYTTTQGQCQWVSRNNTPERCHPTKLYPIFGSWITYNWKFLLFIIITIFALVKIPTKSFNDNIPYSGTILKIIIIFVGIPTASKIYGPSINPEYKDPVVNPTNPSLIDMIYDGDPVGAKWPATWYDDDLDSMVLDDETTYDIYQGSLTPSMLNWTAAFWWLIRKWNMFVNSMGLIGGSIILLILSVYLVKFSPGPIITLLIIGGVLTTLYIMNTLYEDDTSDTYDGNELECPYSSDLLCPNIDADKEICPSGCYSLLHNKMCKDNRNILSFGGIMDPDPKQNVGNYQELSLEDRAIWLDSDDNTYTCPPPIDPPRKKYPYNLFCNDPPEEEDDNCPFPRVIAAARQPDVSEFEQRSGDNIWQSLYNKFTNSDDGQQISDSELSSWQNQTRYHIVGENY